MEPSRLYQITLLIIATANLVTGITLLSLYLHGIRKKQQYKLGIALLSVAMLMLFFINFCEYLLPTSANNLQESLSFVIPSAAIQLILLLYTFVSLLNEDYITKKRIYRDLSLIVLFTLPPLFVHPDENDLLFNSLLYIGVAFYCAKFIHSFLIYQKYLKQAQERIEDFHSDGSVNLLTWINNTFYTIMAVGIVSIIVPLTNYVVLALYSIFLFIAYLYVYIEVLLHLSIFRETKSLPALAISDIPKQASNNKDDTTSRKDMSDFRAAKQNAFDKWIEQRSYSKPGITIDDVATELSTNRSTLSLYLNSELKLNFYEWISIYRIEDAKKQLIENPALSILEIANNVGIEDRSNFDKTFKNIVGVSPANFRKQHFYKK